MALLDPALGYLLRRAGFGASAEEAPAWNDLSVSAAIDALKSGQLGFLGLDVYEEEADLFYRDLAGQVIQDDVVSRLLTFPNVLITGHQAFFTDEAMTTIAETTLANVTAFARGEALGANEVTVDMLAS